MAVGWAREGAVQEQIDATIDDGVELARSRLPKGESLAYCEECEQEIPLACLLYTSPSPRDTTASRMPSSA